MTPSDAILQVGVLVATWIWPKESCDTPAPEHQPGSGLFSPAGLGLIGLLVSVSGGADARWDAGAGGSSWRPPRRGSRAALMQHEIGGSARPAPRVTTRCNIESRLLRDQE